MLDPFYRALEGMGYDHPVHPTQVNMPIGLVVGAFVLVLGAVILRKPSMVVSSRHAAILALFFLVVTAAAGVIDWLHFYSGVWLFPIKIKVGLACFLFILLLSAILLHGRLKNPAPVLIPIFTLSFLTVVTLGYFGANLVFGGRTPHLPRKFRAGEKVFRMNCCGCHPYGGNALRPRNPVIGSDKLPDINTFINWLRNPEAPMPPFPPERISDDDAKQLDDYIRNIPD